MKNKILKRSVLFILILIIFNLLIQTQVNAAGFGASAAKTTMITGETTDLTISVTNAVGYVDIQSSDSAVVSISSTREVFNDPRFKDNYTFC